MHRLTALTVCLLAVACAPGESATMPTRTASQQDVLALSETPDAAVILDVRSADEFRAGHVPNAINIPHDQVAARLHELADIGERKLVVYCESGRRAAKAAAALTTAGISNLLHLEGDMTAWRASGLAQSVGP